MYRKISQVFLLIAFFTANIFAQIKNKIFGKRYSLQSERESFICYCIGHTRGKCVFKLAGQNKRQWRSKEN